MPKISHIRPVLLSAPYAKSGENLEVDLHLKSGFRTTGMVEITLEDGTKGLGEGYLAVFAPKVFESIVALISPHLLGKEIMNIPLLLNDIALLTDYWSLQGAARHVYSAFDIALHDCKARVMGVPVYKLFGKALGHPIAVYGSGGDSPGPEYMIKEFEELDGLGITRFKIRARHNQVKKTLWCMEQGLKQGVDIAVDMVQNLASPGQSVSDVAGFYEFIANHSSGKLFFLEEVLGVWNGHNYPDLRDLIPVKIAGGEIVTTPNEMIERIEQAWYDIVQPDATVIGGFSAMQSIFEQAEKHRTEVLVHCWGGPVGMMANYHAAITGGGKMAEWPMPHYPLRNAMLQKPWQIENGLLQLPDVPGLGVELTREIEDRFPYRDDAIYSCLVDLSKMPPDEVWIK
jgi:L-alanine-DL-glutamate epimerase-like enolase superfamily enzyme